MSEKGEVSVSFTGCTFDGVKVPVSASRGGWMPIETAPREVGQEVLVCWYGLGAWWRVSAYWDGRWWRGLTGGVEVKPTHWMPLPEPPEVGGE